MWRILSKFLVSFALTAALIVPVLPSSAAVNNQVVETIKFSHPTVINHRTVEPGRYLAVARGHELKLETLNHEVVAESPITWRAHRYAFAWTALDIDHGVLTKINMGHTHDAVLLHTS